MKCSVLVAVILFTQQPTKLSEGNRVPKSASTEVSNKTSTPKQSNEDTDHLVVQAQSPRQDDEAKEAEENIRIQGKLVTFTGLLVVVGFLQVGTMIMQWYLMRRQTIFQQLTLSQWIDTDEWEAGPTHIVPNVTMAALPVSFQIGNTTKLPLVLNTVTLWVNRRWHCTVAFRKLLLAPGDWTTVNIRPIDLQGESLARYRARNLAFEIGALIGFIDAFEEEKTRRIGFICRCTPTDNGVFDFIAFDPPSEEEEKAQKKAEQPN
jgi:hypothetical protein